MEAAGRAWRRLAEVWLAVVAGLLVLFGVAEALGVPLLTDPLPALRALSRPVAALAGVALLAVDAVLPVPSSLLMAAFGATYGVAAGTALGGAGALLAGLVGGWLGRRGHRALERAVGEDRPRVEAMLARYGLAAVVVTRPVPLLAESVVLVAGAAGMPLWRLAAGTLLGGVPVAFVYALAGARGRQADATVAFVVLVALALLAVAIPGRRLARTRPEP